MGIYHNCINKQQNNVVIYHNTSIQQLKKEKDHNTINQAVVGGPPYSHIPSLRYMNEH